MQTGLDSFAAPILNAVTESVHESKQALEETLETLDQDSASSLNEF